MPGWGAAQKGAVIAEPSINEASGLVASGDHPGVLWMIGDSFSPPILWAIDTGGRTVGEFQLSGAINVDWEDISIDRLPGIDEIYVPDIGDNSNDRDGTARPLPTIYRLPEPDVSASGPEVIATVPVEAFPIRYADESGNLLPPRNAESYMVDPITHDSFIVEKVPHVVNGKNQYWVSRLPAALTPGVVNLAKRISSIVSNKPLAADISADGQWIMIKGGGKAGSGCGPARSSRRSTPPLTLPAKRRSGPANRSPRRPRASGPLLMEPLRRCTSRRPRDRPDAAGPQPRPCRCRVTVPHSAVLTSKASGRMPGGDGGTTRARAAVLLPWVRLV